MTAKQEDGNTEASMTKTTIDLPESMHRRLRVAAVLEGRSMNAIVLQAITDYLQAISFQSQLRELGDAHEQGLRSEGLEIETRPYSSNGGTEP
jgi:predicted transcriptional regulator